MAGNENIGISKLSGNGGKIQIFVLNLGDTDEIQVMKKPNCKNGFLGLKLKS